MGEKYSLYTALGLLFIVSGVLVITKFSLRISRNNKLKKGITYGIATGIFIAAYTLVDNIAVKRYDISPLVITIGSNLLGAFVLLPLVLRKKDEIKSELQQHKWTILTVALISPIAYILVLIALKYSSLVVVAPARESSIVFGVFMGARLMNEKEVTRRLIASLLIVAGIICLVLN